jgi:hypothetical protein
MTTPPTIAAEKVDAFVARWQGQEGGQERANYALFLTELCDVLELPRPDLASATHERNDHVFGRLDVRSAPKPDGRLGWQRAQVV